MPPKQTRHPIESTLLSSQSRQIRKKPLKSQATSQEYARLTKRALRVQMRSIQKDFSLQEEGEDQNKKQYFRDSNQKLLTSFFQFKNQKQGGTLSETDKSKASTALSEFSSIDCTFNNCKEINQAKNTVKALGFTQSSWESTKRNHKSIGKHFNSQESSPSKKVLRVVKKPKNKFGLLRLKPLRKGHKSVNFMLFKEKNLSFNRAVKQRFKKLEVKTHQDCDQDVDTDEDNLKLGINQLRDHLEQAISQFQKDSKAVEQINNILNPHELPVQQ
eukprot:403333966